MRQFLRSVAWMSNHAVTSSVGWDAG